MMPTTVLVLDGALASSVAITIDVLTMANRTCHNAGRPSAFDIRLVGSGAHLFRPFLAFPEARHDRPSLLIIPAQGLSKAPCYRTRLEEDDAEEARLGITAAAQSGAHVTGSCTGTLLLAGTGLLDGRRATTAWWLAPVFGELFPSIRLETAELVLTDGAFTTAGAAMAQMDLMVGLIARYAGAEVAESCARKMVLDERRSQIPYMAIGLLAASNESVARAASWARARLAESLSVNDLAAAVGQAPRTFSRRVVAATGLSPIQFLQRLRVERAIELIETTLLPFEEIAYRVGYSDASTLRDLVRRGAGLGPRDLRARARGTEVGVLPLPPGLGLSASGRMM
jgi:transcriptional regulator GlxA family with amidase domain